MSSLTIHHWSMGHSEGGYNKTYGYTIVGGSITPDEAYIPSRWCAGHDSNYSWSLYDCYTVNASKTVNYIYLTISPINRIGDVETDRFGKSTTTIKITGPITPGTLYYGKTWDMWNTVNPISVRYEKAVFCYNDGTQENVPICIERNYNDIEFFNIKPKTSSNGYGEVIRVLVGILLCFMAFVYFIGGVFSYGGIKEHWESIKIAVFCLIVGLLLLLWDKILKRVNRNK